MLGIPDLTGVECITVVGIMKPGCLIMRLLSGLVNPDLYHELDSDPLGTVEVGEGWAKVRREALGWDGGEWRPSWIILQPSLILWRGQS